MKIALVDIDSKIPNLALMKLSTFFKNSGIQVKLYRHKWDRVIPKKKRKIIIERGTEFILASKVFESSVMPEINREIILGGVGSGNNNTLDIIDKSIEHLMPDYDLYGSNYSMGFTTRGCSRKCKFCVVPQNEGKIRIATDNIYEFWNKKHKKIVLLDNNILALPEHFMKITDQILKENLQVDFNQGLDHRLLNDEIVIQLQKLKLPNRLRFAFDRVSDLPTVKKTIKLLKKYGIKESFWYVLVGFDTTIEEDLQRIEFLKENKQIAYVQKYNSRKDDTNLNVLASWTNQKQFFKKITFREFLYKGINEYGRSYFRKVLCGVYGEAIDETK